jgi:hypothetical protein
MKTSMLFVRLPVVICLFTIYSSHSYSQSDNNTLAKVELRTGQVPGIFNDDHFSTAEASKPIDEPFNIQCRVFEIIKEPKQRLTCKALSMQGDTIHLKFSWKGRYSSCPVKKGTWVSVYADYKDEKNMWVCRRIKINN